MSVHRNVVISFLGVTFAVAVLARCGSSESSMGKQENRLVDGSGMIESNGGSAVKETGAGVVSFSMDIQPIFDNRCIGCHNGDLLRGGLDLTFPNARDNLVNQQTSSGCMAEVPDVVRVAPGDPQGSMLWRKTKPDDSRCRMPMPLMTDGLGTFAPDEFANIELWIAQGAQDN